MRKQILQLAFFFGLMVPASAAFAFGGCVDSPENPTLLLALLGAAAAVLQHLRKRWRDYGR